MGNVTETLSVREVAARLRCSRDHVYRLIAAGALRPVDLSQPDSARPKTRVRPDDLAAFIDARTAGRGAP